MIDRKRIENLKAEVGEDDLAEVVMLFCEEVEETLDRIRAPAARIVPDDLHFLKGSALNIGFVEMAGLCQLAEKSLRKDPTACPNIHVISQAFAKARRTLLKEVGA